MGKVTGNERFWGEFSGKSIISNIPVFPFQNGKFQNLGEIFGYPYSWYKGDEEGGKQHVLL